MRGTLPLFVLYITFSPTVDLQRLEHGWLVYQGCFELESESLGKIQKLHI